MRRIARLSLSHQPGGPNGSHWIDSIWCSSGLLLQIIHRCSTYFRLRGADPNTLETNFISRNNDDRTAEATFRFMQMAGIPRSETVIWNTGPGWDRDIANSARTARRDAALLRGFVEALPRLEAAVLVGGAARRYAWPLVAERGLLTFETVHASLRAQGHPEKNKTLSQFLGRSVPISETVGTEGVLKTGTGCPKNWDGNGVKPPKSVPRTGPILYTRGEG